MKKKKKHCDRQNMFFLGTVVMVMFCIPFCSSAQKTEDQEGIAVNENADQHPFHCGDAVGITVAPDSASFLNRQYAIDDEGTIDLPIIGKKQVTSMTQEELTNFINNSYVKYLRVPSVRVQPLIRLELMGGFQRPGFYYISPHASFWEVFCLAGAPIREDGLEKLKLSRSSALIDFDPVHSIETAQSLRQMGIRSGDRIMVTARPLKTTWDSFKDDVFPILSLTLSLAATTATAYISYQTFNRGGR